MKIITTIVLCVSLSASSLYAGNDFSDDGKCGGQTAVGDKFRVQIYGQDSECKVVSLNIVTGSGGNKKGGGDCGEVVWPYFITGGCGELVKNGTGPE